MPKINWTRVLLGGLVAGGIWTVLSVILLTLLGGEFLSTVERFKPNQPPGAQAFLLFSNFAAATWAIWLYAAIRPRFGPGPKTAVIAAVAWWFIASLQSGKWLALGAAPLSAAPALLAATLPAIIAATLAGAWLYQE